MNIALISREFPPFYGGGIGTYTEQAAVALAEAGHRVVVVTMSHDGCESRVAHAADSRILVVRLPLIVGDDWSCPAPSIDGPITRACFSHLGPWSVFSKQVADALPGLVREHAIDVIEGPECGAILWWTLNQRRLGAEVVRSVDGASPLYVVQLHSPNAWIDEQNRESPPNRAAFELRRAERESAMWADLVIAPSVDIATWAGERWGIGPVENVPYPLGSIGVRSERRLDGGGAIVGATGGLRCLMIGRAEPRKGVDVLVRAIAIACRRGIDVSAEIAGQDTRDWRTGAWFAQRCMSTMLPAEMRERVSHLGKLDRARLADARQRADVCVAPGAVDNFPYAVVESMARGLPVIAPSVGGIAELVREGIEGHIFVPHDPGSLADAFSRHAVLSHDQRARMGEASAARVAWFCGNGRAVSVRERVFGEAIRRGVCEGERSVRDVRHVGGDASLLAGPVRRGVVDFAIGWERARDGMVVPFGTPTLEALASMPSIRGPLAVRADLIERYREETGNEDPASDEMACWLVQHGARGAVDPSVVTEVGPCGEAEGEDRPILIDERAFRSVVPLRMARRNHPLPWVLAPARAGVTGLPMRSGRSG
ncbi:MAG: glycosyltransferase family 4 protein [Phycisphaeraceae bacterium]|nr:glycosyltransferase family 4 protein [Phycisphaeraceae bacterium]